MTNHVHLVDEDEAVRNALSFLLETVGLSVRRFALPEAFLAQAAKLPPCCLILDIRISAISGLKLQEKRSRRGSTGPSSSSAVMAITRPAEVPFATGRWISSASR